MNRCYRLKQWLGRWILANSQTPDLAWSGCRWVPIGGVVQVCNFESRELANIYADKAGLHYIGEAV